MDAFTCDEGILTDRLETSDGGMQALHSTLTADLQPAGNRLQLPAVLLHLFCKAIRTVRGATEGRAAAGSALSAEADSRTSLSIDSSADLQFFMHLLSLIRCAMHTASGTTASHQPSASTVSNVTAMSFVPAEAPTSGSKRAKSKGKRENASLQDTAQVRRESFQGSDSRWAMLASAATAMLKAAQQLGVYRPNEDTTGNNRAFLAQLASDLCSHVACMQQTKDLVRLFCLLAAEAEVSANRCRLTVRNTCVKNVCLELGSEKLLVWQTGAASFNLWLS